MRINGFRCDVCSKEHLFDSRELMTNMMGELLPTDWYLVNHGKFEQGKEPIMLCSLRCLADWTQKQLPEPKEVMPEERRENWW